MAPRPFLFPIIGSWSDIPKVKPWVEFEKMPIRCHSGTGGVWPNPEFDVVGRLGYQDDKLLDLASPP
jgi:hypothetical protein